MSRTIQDFPNYTITPEGVVCNVQGKALKLGKHKEGYINVYLYKEGRMYARLQHRLVAEAYLPNPYAKPLVNHKDGCRSNNALDNLEWVTASENNLHAAATGGYPNGEQHWAWKGGSSRISDIAKMERRAAQRALTLARYEGAL